MQTISLQGIEYEVINISADGVRATPSCSRVLGFTATNCVLRTRGVYYKDVDRFGTREFAERI